MSDLEQEIKHLKRKNKLLEQTLHQNQIIHKKYTKALEQLEEKDQALSKINSDLDTSYSMLHKLTENIPGAIYQYKLTPDDKASFPYASVGIQNIYGVFPLDVLNDAKPMLDNLHEDDRAIFVSSIKNSAHTMTNWNLEYRVNLPQKGVRWLHGQANPEKLEDGSILWHGYINDITEQKYLRDALKEEHKYLQSIIDGVNGPIMIIKEDYTVEIMNDALKKSLKNIKIADPKNPKCYEISHHRSTPCDGINHPCPLQEVFKTQTPTVVIHNHYVDNEERHIELLASPLFDKDDNCIGIVESAKDITKHLSMQNELKEQKSILNHQVHHDALTGLSNRIYFNEKLKQAIRKAKNHTKKIALLFIDLDHFKTINDSLGHAIGDEVLKIITQRLLSALRKEDTISRLGGDEFAVILENLTHAGNSSSIAKKILQVLSQPMHIHDNTLYLSSSIGISIYPNDGESAQNLLKFADSAMYKAKDEGRNNYQFYNSSMTELAFERVVMETSLRYAIENKEFVVYYQPQVNGVTQKLIGMEALVRWKHPTMGLVSPAKFIPLAESTGLIVDIDRLVMQSAMQQICQWNHKKLNPGILAINLSIKHLEQKDFFTKLKSLLEETKCKPEWIELEVTEGHLMNHPEKSIQILEKISNLGIELAIDDFGTGYSSLSYLKKFPIDKLKIDQIFVRELPHDEDDAGITKAVIALAKSLNLKIIAEGVEKIEQKDFLVDNGCENIQGYLYSKPIPAHEMEELLINCKKNKDKCY